MNRVRSERILRGLSQNELAKTLDVNKSTVVRWERGGSISSEHLLQLREVFGCDIDWLLGVTDDRTTIYYAAQSL